MQNELGFLNDAAVAHRLLTDMSAARPELQSSAGFVKVFSPRALNADEGAIVKLWKQFKPNAIPR